MLTLKIIGIELLDQQSSTENAGVLVLPRSPSSLCCKQDRTSLPTDFGAAHALPGSGGRALVPGGLAGRIFRPRVPSSAAGGDGVPREGLSCLSTLRRQGEFSDLLPP